MGDLQSFPTSSMVVNFSPPGSFIRGDVEGSGSRDLSDVIAIFELLFLGDRAITCQDAADADDNGIVDFTDGIVLMKYLLTGTAVIPPPGMSAPWLDPTDDALGCDA